MSVPPIARTACTIGHSDIRDDCNRRNTNRGHTSTTSKLKRKQSRRQRKCSETEPIQGNSNEEKRTVFLAPACQTWGPSTLRHAANTMCVALCADGKQTPNAMRPREAGAPRNEAGGQRELTQQQAESRAGQARAHARKRSKASRRQQRQNGTRERRERSARVVVAQLVAARRIDLAADGLALVLRLVLLDLRMSATKGRPNRKRKSQTRMDCVRTRKAHASRQHWTCRPSGQEQSKPTAETRNTKDKGQHQEYHG